MEAGGSIPIGKEQAPRLTANWRPMRYLGTSFDGSALFEHGMASAYANTYGDQLTGISVDMSSLMDRLGMPPKVFKTSDGVLAATGFGAAGPDEGVMSGQTLAESNGNRSPAPQKAPWTEEEDSMLRELVEHHGERKWSVIARYLPGRIGKQCRERWINHLRPDIKQNDIWTEDADKVLIEAHRYYGNRWSTIAKHLPGRSENAIKNHWNATLRSLKAKRRMKKKKSEQVPDGQFSVLEEYIRSIYPEDVTPSAPSSQHQPAYDGMQSPIAHAAPATSFAIPSTAEMSFNGDKSASMSLNLGTINLNMSPKVPDLNTINDSQEYSLNYPKRAPEPAPQLQQATTQDPRQACSSLCLHPYADYFKLLCSDHGTYYAGASSSNPGTNGYYREAARTSFGGSGHQAVNTNNMEVPSREFLAPYNGEVLTRFQSK